MVVAFFRRSEKPPRQPKNSKRAKLRAPALQNITKIPREETRKEGRKNENCGREKRAKFWGGLAEWSGGGRSSGGGSRRSKPFLYFYPGHHEDPSSSSKVQTRATCQPAHTQPPKWRCSSTTSAVDGVGSSHPPLPLASSRDDAKALALLHAMMVIHRRSHAALARDWRGTA